AHAGRDVAAGIALRGPHGGKPGEIDLAAELDHLLHRRALASDHDRRDRLGDALAHAPHDLLLRHAERQAPFAAAGDDLARDAPARRSLDALEQAALALLGKGPPAHRREIFVGIDLGTDADELAGRFQPREMRADRLVGHAQPSATRGKPLSCASARIARSIWPAGPRGPSAWHTGHGTKPAKASASPRSASSSRHRSASSRKDGIASDS